jgi:phage repressor protein C with HTH and peptisase S24 domain
MDNYQKPLPVLERDENGRDVPFYDFDVYATISPVLTDYISMTPAVLTKIPMFASADGAVQVKGHSMKGYINHGDWIVIKRITNRDMIIYGEPYLVVTKSDHHKTVKFIKQCYDDDDMLSLVPYNIEQFDPQNIPKDEILEMYAVIGLFRSM